MCHLDLKKLSKYTVIKNIYKSIKSFYYFSNRFLDSQDTLASFSDEQYESYY